MFRRTDEFTWILKRSELSYEVVRVIPGFHNGEEEDGYFIYCALLWVDSYSPECKDDYARMCGFTSVEDIKLKYPADWEEVVMVCVAKATGYIVEGSNAFHNTMKKVMVYCNSNWFNHSGEDTTRPLPITANIVV